MTKKILADAGYSGEIRVALLHDDKLHDFDHQTKLKREVKGNIYLAKITRVEASLQAAFIDYGEDRHGFLPFSEIHYDYYNIPTDDKKEIEQMIAQQTVVEEETDEESDIAAVEDNTNMTSEVIGRIRTITNTDYDNNAKLVNEDEAYCGAQDIVKHKDYKIQEVIKKNQIVLVQVIKEERGNKGASLTTYISLAGKYCVLMPNSRGNGGVSRRITDTSKRKALRAILDKIETPDDAMNIIVRTSGADAGEEDIRCDYQYLVKLWDNIRKQTLLSNAPAFIHTEGDIIKRMIRNMCFDDIDEIVVQGTEAYEQAKGFLQQIEPKKASILKQHTGAVPIFTKYKVEEQISKLYDMEVKLPSGGYIVINPTEALISIDVNSGKLTSERNIEKTAHKTNMEAAEEVARQLRLRDISGLIVVDFIDMRDTSHRMEVEKTILNALLKYDRARIQILQISPFGLLEISRQRLKPSLSEAHMLPCSRCHGKGIVRAPESLALMILRSIHSELSGKDTFYSICVHASSEMIVYMLNYKKNCIADLEIKYATKILVEADDHFGTEGFAIEKGKKKGPSRIIPRGKPADKDNVEKIPGKTNHKKKPHTTADSAPSAPAKPGIAKKPPTHNKAAAHGGKGKTEGIQRYNATNKGSHKGGSNVDGDGNVSSLLQGIWKRITE